MRALSIAFVLCAACGPGRAYYQCPAIQDLGTVLSEAPVDCEAFAANYKQALLMTGYSGLIPFGSEHDFRRLTVVLEDGDFVREHPTHTGWYDGPSQTATLARQGASLLHEMFHHWETVNLVLNTGDHPQWDQKGYNAMCGVYEHGAASSL